MNAKPLREAMPTVATFVDACRNAFGTDAVNRAIRNSQAGGTDFYASENGRVLGARPPVGARFTVQQLLLSDFPSPKGKTTP